MNKIQKNKLTIYLIKEEYSDPKDIFKKIETLNTETIKGVWTIYYDNSHATQPTWVGKFLWENFKNEKEVWDGKKGLKLFNASTKALILVEVDQRKYALNFWFGHTLVNNGVFEERFWLKLAVNIFDQDGIRKIGKTSMNVTSKNSEEQISKNGWVGEFWIDIEQDLVRSMTWKIKAGCEAFGKIVTGKDSLSLSTEIELKDIKDFLWQCYKKFISNEYKKDFDWIDQIAEIKDKKIINELNSEIIEKINNQELEKVWLAIPEVLKWEEVDFLRLGKNSEKSFWDDMDLKTFINFLSPKKRESITIQILKSETVECINTNGVSIADWRIFNCLYAELQQKWKIYILNNGKWYEIAGKFAESVIKEFENMRNKGSSLILPNCKPHEKENDYNIRVAKELSMECMDCKTVTYWWWKSKIEFCDLYIKEEKIIHIKHYWASSVLSHLFAQGLVSWELLMSDEHFRKLVNEKMDDKNQWKNTEEKPNGDNYEVIFWIITTKADTALEIPFFSKVNLRNASRRLKGFGFKEISLLTINTK